MTNSERARKTAEKVDMIWVNLTIPKIANPFPSTESRRKELSKVILSALNEAVKEKDEEIAELLTALNNIQGELFDFAILFNVALLEIPNHKKQITDYIDKIENIAFKLITKHKGE